ncbi:unnamed protein product [Chondrus crispus]|uniref:Secreted protein n=1 Tax=Chondrus crispus TaxID=2769 RepID=R7QM50_CHOCR|nr:unnamed protein product [Chondrus crispus]CDF38460.1 unnamed protein product [Chondrus crispus]|eukprot:XP_005718353.1 unnamed protein product [Chondrus crispus]
MLYLADNFGVLVVLFCVSQVIASGDFDLAQVAFFFPLQKICLPKKPVLVMFQLAHLSSLTSESVKRKAASHTSPSTSLAQWSDSIATPSLGIPKVFHSCGAGTAVGEKDVDLCGRALTRVAFCSDHAMYSKPWAETNNLVKMF